MCLHHYAYVCVCVSLYRISTCPNSSPIHLHHRRRRRFSLYIFILFNATQYPLVSVPLQTFQCFLTFCLLLLPLPPPLLRSLLVLFSPSKIERSASVAMLVVVALYIIIIIIIRVQSHIFFVAINIHQTQYYYNIIYASFLRHVIFGLCLSKTKKKLKISNAYK